MSTALRSHDAYAVAAAWYVIEREDVVQHLVMALLTAPVARDVVM